MGDATDTTLARGLPMPNLKPKPKLIPLLMLGTDTMDTLDITGMAEDTMVDTMDTVMDTDTGVKKLFWNVISCHFFKQPLELSKPTLLPSAILLKTVFFLSKIVTKLIFGPIVIKNSQKMPLFFKKRDLCNIIRTALWL